MTASYNAGFDTSDAKVAFIAEATWNVTPTTPTFKYIRLTGEGLTSSKTRARPGEIRATGDASHAITQQEVADGNLSFAFSYGTYDEFLAALVNGVWTTPLAIDDISNDISASVTLGAGSGVGFDSTLTDKFNDVVVGQWVRVSGFVASSGANNGLYRVIAVVTGASPEMEVSATAGNGSNVEVETPASETQHIRGSMTRNGTTVTTFQIEKQFAAAIFLAYGGAYVSGGTLSAQVGSLMEGSFDFLMASEIKGTSTLSTGGTPTAAETGNVIDTVAGFSKLEIADAAVTAVAQGIEVTLTKEGARSQYGLGSAAAQGMGRGTITVGGSFSIYFTDFTEYDLYTNETDSIVSFAAIDAGGDGYIITIPAATLMNPTIVAGGPDTDIVGEFELEGNPATDAVYSGVTIQIDKIPAAV